MITKKCLVSFIVCGISLLLIFAAVHLMSLFTVSKWLGVIVGAGILCLTVVALILYWVYRKKVRVLPFFLIAVASLATGIVISSLFVYVGAYPPIWQTAVLYGCLVASFYLYCLCTRLSFWRAHGYIALAIFAVCLFTTNLLLLCFLHLKIFILSLIILITYMAFLISLPLDADDEKDHISHLVLFSFGFFVLTLALVVMIISEGGFDGLDFSGGGDGTSKRKKTYDYLYKGLDEYL